MPDARDSYVILIAKRASGKIAGYYLVAGFSLYEHRLESLCYRLIPYLPLTLTPPARGEGNKRQELLSLLQKTVLSS